MKQCFVNDTLAAFCLRSMWDRGTECCKPEQDQDDGKDASLEISRCTIISPQVNRP